MRRRHALCAYDRLQALDPTAAERCELVSSGVSAHHARALYPDASYSSLAPHLIDHLRSVPNATLMARARFDDRAILALTSHLPDALAEDAAACLDDDQSAGLAANPTVEQYLIKRFVKTARGVITPLAVEQRCLIIASEIWWAWWAMGLREHMARQQQVAADDLMLLVERTIAL